jgi:hypothetical protein
MRNGKSNDLEQRLAALRSALEQNTEGVMDNARTLVDWRHHFRRHPALFCGAAAALGFALVPRRSPPLVASRNDESPGPEMRQPVQAAASAPQQSAGAVLASVVAQALARKAAEFVAERGSRFLAECLAVSTPAKETEPAEVRQS